mgnify:CR=1 FL=1
MDVRQLRYFLTIGRCGSFSRASVELNVAQPALSHHVANLEAELGVKLFDRSTRGVVATECGKTLMHHAEIILRQMTHATRDVQDCSSQPSGPVQIGLPTSVSIELAVPLLTEVEKRFPEITLNVNENHSGYLSEWLGSGQLDLAILFDVEENAAFDLTYILTEPLYFVTAPGGPAAGRDAVDLDSLNELPLVVTGQAHGLRQVLDRHQRDNGLRLNVKTELDSLSAIKKLVGAGYGHSVLPWCAIQAECRAGALCAVEIRNPTLSREVYIASSKDWALSRAAEVIAGVTSELVRGLVASDRMRGTQRP